MKRVTINTNEIGLVIKNNAVVRVLTIGKYWLGFGEKLDVYDLSKPVQSTLDIDVLLQVSGFAEHIELVEVADTEICLVFVNNNFKQMLAAGIHVFWKGLQNYRFQKEDITNIEIGATVNKQLLEKQTLLYYVRQFKLEPSEKGLLFLDGVFTKVLDAGTYYWWKNATSIAISKVDMRLTTMDIVGQEILTKDKAQIRINFSIQYQVVDVLKALLENKEFEKQLYMLMQLALRAYIGRMTLDELMENKSEINTQVLSETAAQVELLGVKVFHAGVKDIILPGDIREIMNQVLVAEKKAQANIITRREETASTRSLLNTAKLMEENAMLFKLKEMEYVEKIAEKINNISVSGNGQVVDQLKQLFVK
ncbi:slipin family protein [Sphingobacterium sp. SRCM116780]|uniref:slipin family protein n=1 Tax=Sphingobacterium sp. SRCM116780 TaxID=2907623 RepID=UPI001F38772B|nr:slipin family protein [Sphingobacterium sp. SRCM116780]UIR55550.1 slipin family protein [Sphingobacterium sp. SRCM116780]